MPSKLKSNEVQVINELKYYIVQIGDKSFAVEKKDVLGKGSFGSVYKGYPYNPKNNEITSYYPKAIKVVTTGGEVQIVEWTKKEAKILEAKQVHKGNETVFFETSRDAKILMDYIDGKPIAQVEQKKLVYNPDLDKLSVPQRFALFQQIIDQFNFIHHETQRGCKAVYYGDVKFENTLISVTDTVIMYPARDEDLYKIDDKNLSKTEYAHNFEKWKKANDPGTVLFAYDQVEKRWKAYRIIDSEKHYDEKDIHVDSIFYAELQKIGPDNALTFNTKTFQSILKENGKFLFGEGYVYQEPKYIAKATVIDYGLAAELEDENQKIPHEMGTLIHMAPEVMFRPSGLAADIFALASIGLVLADGKPTATREQYLKTQRDLMLATPFDIEGVKDYDIPISTTENLNIKPIYLAFFQKMMREKDDKRPSIDELSHFNAALVGLLFKAEEKKVNDEKISYEDIRFSLGKVISLSGYLETNQSKAESKEYREQCRLIVKVYSKPLEDHARSMIRQMQQILAQEREEDNKDATETIFFHGENGNGIKVTKAEKSLLDIIEMAYAKKISYGQAIIKVQRTLQKTETSATSVALIKALNENVESMANKKLELIQDKIFFRAAKKEWSCNYFSRETVHLHLDNNKPDQYAIDKDARTILDFIEDVRDHKISNMAGLIKVEQKLQEIMRNGQGFFSFFNKSSSDMGFYKSLLPLVQSDFENVYQQQVVDEPVETANMPL